MWGEIHFCEFHLQELCQVLSEYWRKILILLASGEEQGTILKYARAFCPSKQGLTSGETISTELNLLGFY